MEKKISKREINEHSAGIIPVRKVGNIYLFLLMRSYNFWNFPKGHIEIGETALDAAKREMFEESGLNPNNIKFKWGLEEYVTEPFKKGKKVDIFFIGETDEENVVMKVNPELGKPEHEEYRWVTFENGMKMVNERIGKALTWAKNKIM